VLFICHHQPPRASPHTLSLHDALPISIYDMNERAVNSLYGSAEFSYKNMLFLTGTVRNDWFSTLSVANRSIIYPSVSASWVFTRSAEHTSELQSRENLVRRLLLEKKNT